MVVTLVFADASEAAAFAGQLREVVRLAYGVRQAEPPWLLRTGAEKISAAARGSAEFRTDMQVSASRGTAGFHEGRSLPLSDQPVRLGTREAAQLAQVSEGLIRRLCRRKNVQASGGNGSPWAVDIASLAAWISQRRKDNEHSKAA